ncbi:circumsporozoite protein-like [Mesocricetus auratus]|uniref:Circumsporozoite protein-like n=1 Tax=Mesocricetus auratus TaxID=10036 RepID=A0ABM2XIE9_MESAU|nr:circumsporozoite protein-like [Mesocricetus auratus]
MNDDDSAGYEMILTWLRRVKTDKKEGNVAVGEGAGHRGGGRGDRGQGAQPAAAGPAGQAAGDPGRGEPARPGLPGTRRPGPQPHPHPAPETRRPGAGRRRGREAANRGRRRAGQGPRQLSRGAPQRAGQENAARPAVRAAGTMEGRGPATRSRARTPSKVSVPPSPHPHPARDQVPAPSARDSTRDPRATAASLPAQQRDTPGGAGKQRRAPREGSSPQPPLSARIPPLPHPRTLALKLTFTFELSSGERDFRPSRVQVKLFGIPTASLFLF